MHRELLLLPALLVVLAGCGGSTDGPVSASRSTAVPSPSPTQTGVPVEARAATPEGAEAFVRHWYAVLNEAAASGDTTELRTLAVPECGACEAFADSIDYLYREGGGIEGGRFTVRSADAPPMPAGARSVLVAVQVDITTTRQLAKDGSIDREIAGISGGRAAQLVRVGEQWRMRELDEA